jgi:excisionase family DNA binding protein
MLHEERPTNNQDRLSTDGAITNPNIGGTEYVNLDHDSPYLTVEEAATYLKTPVHTFTKLVARRYRKIPMMKMGKRIIFKKELLDDWAERIMMSKMES